jgi:uncharacterized protein YjbJ (UPF0337 family)
MNEDIFKGKWRQLRGEIKRKWGRITDDELDEAEGNADKLIGRIQEEYGQSREQVERELEQMSRGA